MEILHTAAKNFKAKGRIIFPRPWVDSDVASRNSIVKGEGGLAISFNVASRHQLK